MANASKNKGDRAELEAVEILKELCGDLVVPKAKRMLGAGRAEDVGDLHVFTDVAVQVRCYKMDRIGLALRSAAVDSRIQAGHGDMTLALGMVPYPGARKVSMRWMATFDRLDDFPALASLPVTDFKMVGRALAFLRDDKTGLPRCQRIARLSSANTETYYLAPIETFVAAYQNLHGRTHDCTCPPVAATS